MQTTLLGMLQSSLWTILHVQTQRTVVLCEYFDGNRTSGSVDYGINGTDVSNERTLNVTNFGNALVNLSHKVMQ